MHKEEMKKQDHESLVIELPTAVVDHIQAAYCQGYKKQDRDSVKAWIGDLVSRAAMIHYKSSKRETLRRKYIYK